MKRDTRIIHAGSHPERWNGAVNPPVWRASTIVSPSIAAQREMNGPDRFANVTYGRHGTPTSKAFEEAVAELEGGSHCIAVGSGLAAITATLTGLLKTGDHLLMTDGCYGPTRYFCDKSLSRFGIETTYYDPRIGADSASLIRPNTRVVFVESPSSGTFEIQDVPAIAAAAHAAGALVVADNTWGLGTFMPFEHGVDVSLQAATKYIVGHSDAMLGTITVNNADLYATVRGSVALFGYSAGSEEVWLGLRGLRTLSVRLRQQFASGLAIANWLESRPEVLRVWHPALPSHPGHALWRRDFTGGCSLFSFELHPVARNRLEAMVDGYHLFQLGYSWGGFESLAVLTSDEYVRTATGKSGNPIVRLHVGLEDPEDLIADLEQGFARLKETP